MATWTTTKSSTVYSFGDHLGESAIASISDGDNSNLEFTVGETVTITLSNGTSGRAHFVGTTTAIEGGAQYPVFRSGTSASPGSTHWVIGTGRTRTPGNATGQDLEAPNTVGGLSISASTFTVCFFPGSLIATPTGERCVEDLVPGDPVLIGDVGSVPVPKTWIARLARNLLHRLGYRRAVPVKCVGRQTVSTRFGPADRLMPVHFAAGSLSGGATPSAA